MCRGPRDHEMCDHEMLQPKREQPVLASRRGLLGWAWGAAGGAGAPWAAPDGAAQAYVCADTCPGSVGPCQPRQPLPCRVGEATRAGPGVSPATTAWHMAPSRAGTRGRGLSCPPASPGIWSVPCCPLGPGLSEVDAACSLVLLTHCPTLSSWKSYSVGQEPGSGTAGASRSGPGCRSSPSLACSWDLGEGQGPPGGVGHLVLILPAPRFAEWP